MKYGLLGEHLSHSYSPLIHSMLGDYEYSLFEVPPDDLCAFLRGGDFSAVNVTIPYKKAVIPFLDQVSDRVKKIGSVNVILKREDGTLFGDNTDYGGFASLVRRSKIKIKGKKVLVLGSGGASLTVQAVLKDMGAGNVTVISRRGGDNYSNLYRHKDADVIVNTTPVGMYPDCGQSPCDLSEFNKLSGVLDLIYNPAKTDLILQAEELGIPARGGLHMLVAQAVLANELFFQKPRSSNDTDTIEKALATGMKNVVLIGMPGCGKSTIGKRIAAITGRPFIDIDAEIVKATGRSIPDIFSEDGEETFREIETGITAEFCKKSGCIISTGGGVVTQPRNRRLLRQNSTVVFISRGLDSLATKGRPLSETSSAQTLWEKRSPMYRDWSDLKVLNTGIPNTAHAIIRALHLPPKRSK